MEAPQTRSDGIPIVHESRAVTGSGILTEKQKAWINGASNNIYIENPVFQRFLKEKKHNEEKQKAKSNDVIDVRGLMSDEIAFDNYDSGIISKIQKSRKERHEIAMDDMMQELASISLDLEPQIQEVCETHKNYLDEDTKEIQSTFSKILDDENLALHSLKSLHSLWHKIEKHFPARELWIKQLDTSLQSIEKNRSQLIKNVLSSYMNTFEYIAYLMPADVHRLIEAETTKINISLLNNQNSHAELLKRLMMLDIKQEKKLSEDWNNRLEDWKAIKLEEAVEKHKRYMESDAVVCSPLINKHLNDLVKEQTLLNQRRIDLLNQLKHMKPPSSTKAALYQWNVAVTDVTNQLDKVHDKYISSLISEQQKILSSCNDHVRNTLDSLLTDGIINEHTVDQLVPETFYPLIGERKAIFDYELEKVEKCLYETTATQKQLLKDLFKFAQGAGHIWDNHELGLAKEERSLQEMLSKNRRDHDYINQVKEAKLDIVMDRMRQDSSQDMLSFSLKQSLTMLEEIKNGYYDFHGVQKTTCEKYPRMIKSEITRYSSSVYTYFKVREHEKGNSNHYGMGVLDKFTLTNGVKFDVLDYTSEEDEYIQNSLVAQDFIEADMQMEVLPYVDSFALPKSMFKILKENMRNEFLEHLQKWCDDCYKKAEATMMAKFEEINNELDLRLHLHEPRPKRAEYDVHNVRAGELLLHRNRVEQHCSGISETLTSLKTCYQEMLDEHVMENEKFRKSVEELETSFSNASNTNELKAMQEQVNGKLDQYMDVIRASVRHFRFNLDDMLNRLRNSNAQFRKSLKLFSEGGNFSPDEVEEYRKQLEKVATKIDNCEGQLMGELEGMETKRMDIAKEFAGKLEDRYKYHLLDLTFIEKVKRWLTNIQVKIKAEVANSNSQSQHLSKIIVVFNRRLEQLKKPGGDEPSVSVEELHETLAPLLASFHERVEYLDCAVKRHPLPSSNHTMIEKVIVNPKQETTTKERVSSRRSWKKGPKKFDEKKPTRNIKSQQSNTSRQSMQSTIASPDDNNSIAQQASRNSVVDEANSVDSPKPSSTYGRQSCSNVRTQFGGRYDRKYLAFGETDPDMEPATTFMQLQIQILKVGLGGLLNTAELYYRQKGMRSTTRPQFINEMFDSCAENLIQRLNKYKEQTETYHKDCIQEFRSQIKLFSKSIQQLPDLLTKSCVRRHLKSWTRKDQEIEAMLKTKKERNERLKKENQTLLRPTLGHPNNKNELGKLKSSELSRQKEADEMIVGYEDMKKEEQLKHFTEFAKDLQDVSVLLLSQFDTLVTSDDVINGAVVQSKPRSEKELLKEKLTGLPTEPNDEFPTISLTSSTWPGIHKSKYDSKGEIIQNGCNILTSLTSSKKTPAHDEVIRARDNAFEFFVIEYVKRVGDLTTTCEKLRSGEERWMNNWKMSLEKILALY